MIATAVNVEGRREIVGFDVVTTESTTSWTAFLRSLVARGLCGVELVISDAHGGIKNAIGSRADTQGWAGTSGQGVGVRRRSLRTSRR